MNMVRGAAQARLPLNKVSLQYGNYNTQANYNNRQSRATDATDATDASDTRRVDLYIDK